MSIESSFVANTNGPEQMQWRRCVQKEHSIGPKTFTTVFANGCSLKRAKHFKMEYAKYSLYKNVYNKSNVLYVRRQK